MWLSKEDLEEMLRKLIEDEALQAHVKQQKIELLDGCHDLLTKAVHVLENGPVDKNLVLIHSQIKGTIENIEEFTMELLK